MIDFKDLECLVALARTRHFARAAQECGLSQPAFSMRIRHLEENLNVSIVKRGNRFQQLTPEGEKVLAHARDILERTQVLEREIRATKGEVSGALVLGVVPTAVAVAAQLAIRLHASHQGLRTRIITASSLSIQQGIEDRAFDAGLTYSDGISSDLMHIYPVYSEHYVLVAPTALVQGQAETMTWAEASELPLSLLEPSMQNRKILDRVFQDVGVRPKVIFDSNGFNAAIVIAKQGVAATIVPKVLMQELGSDEDVRVLDLVDPVVEKEIAIVAPRQAAKIVIIDALREAVQDGFHDT